MNDSICVTNTLIDHFFFIIFNNNNDKYDKKIKVRFFFSFNFSFFSMFLHEEYKMKFHQNLQQKNPRKILPQRCVKYRKMDKFESTYKPLLYINHRTPGVKTMELKSSNSK